MNHVEIWLDNLLANRANKDWAPLVYAREATAFGILGVLVDPSLPEGVLEVRSADDAKDIDQLTGQLQFRVGDVMARYSGPRG